MRQALIFLFLVVTVGCVTVYNPATEKKEIYFIDDKSEVSIGKSIAREVIRDNHIIKDYFLNKKVERIGEKIARVCDRNYLSYHFYIIDEKGINAFSLPGGYIFVNKEAVNVLSEDELAFVLAHEIGHVCARHAVKRLQASLGMSLVLSLALKDAESVLIRDATDIIYNLVALGYSRQDEFLADSLAVKYTYKAGYNPKAGVTLMEKLKRGTKSNYTLVFLRSHPPILERIKNIEEKIEAINASRY